MQQAYPPFINSYESIKQCFEQADQKHPRFHTFIRVCLVEDFIIKLLFSQKNQTPNLTVIN